MRVIYIEWFDALSYNKGWINKDEVDEYDLPIIKSIGILVSEDDKKITISTTFDEENEAYCGFVMVPKAWVKKRKWLTKSINAGK